MSLNKVMVIGRLGRDPELKYTQAGAPVCTLSIATDESYTDNSGQRVEKAEWHRVVVFQKAAENCSQYLAKGSLVFVEGSLQTRKWQDQQGRTATSPRSGPTASSSSTARATTGNPAGNRADRETDVRRGNGKASLQRTMKTSAPPSRPRHPVSTNVRSSKTNRIHP